MRQPLELWVLAALGAGWDAGAELLRALAGWVL